MKKLLLLILTTICWLNLSAQVKNIKQDIIQKINGEQLKGKIVKMTDTYISFVYAGENLEYKIKKADITTITHASGRVETFSQPASPPQVAVTPEKPVDHHNKIAILPLTFIKDNSPGADEIGLKAQGDAYAFLSKHTAGYTLIDPRTTNALLMKAGVTKDKMMGFTMKELCDILGAEYVIDGTITQTKAAQTTFSTGSSNANVKRDGNDKVKGASTSDFGITNSSQNYDVAVSFNIYMDNNTSIYNEKHKAIFGNTDGSYSSPMEYLLKRCPLYKK